jgi:hypothetical protein
MATDSPQFEIGVALAGAISAGAYSAGVFDFLCEALAEWQMAKDDEAEKAPQHSVCIKVMSGASAGAITAAVGVIALSKGLRPSFVPGKPAYRYNFPELYDGWVVKPDLASAAGKNDLLSLEDIPNPNDAQDKRVLLSILNALCLDDIAKAALSQTAPVPETPYPWIGKPLHLFFMITNLRGVPYEVGFHGNGSDKATHVMMTHGDRAHFAVTELGSGTSENQWCQQDPSLPLQRRALNVPGAPDWRPLVFAGLASGAFPIGLSARHIEEVVANYGARNWPSLQLTGQHKPVPVFPTGFSTGVGAVLKYTAPDGGMINNEPFEYAHSGILQSPGEPNPRAADEAVRAVIMIDPFPEPPDFELDEMKAADGSLTRIPGLLITALKNQARFKPEEIVAAMDPEIYSRYLVAPKRSDQDDPMSSKPLATALLGGFGGFLDRSFREHDYQLGRRNCQQFLQEHFAVGLNNPIAVAAQAAAVNQQFDKNHQHVRVIPLFGTAYPPIDLPEWPRIDYARLQAIETRIRGRADAVVSELAREKSGSFSLRMAIKALWASFVRSRALDWIHWMLLSELIRCDQMKGYENISDGARAIAVALCDKKYDYWSAQSLEKMKPDEGLKGAMEKLAKGPLKIWEGKVGDIDCYCWDDRRPGWVARNLPGLQGEVVIG